MHVVRRAVLAAWIGLWPAAALAETVSLQVTDPKGGFKRDFVASWVRTDAARERYWVCDRPLWVAPGVGHRITRAYQSGAHIDIVAVAGDAGGRRVICTLADPSQPNADKAAADVGKAHAK